jgi:hypothetical protein
MSEDIDPFQLLNLPEEDVSQAAVDKVRASCCGAVLFKSSVNYTLVFIGTPAAPKHVKIVRVLYVRSLHHCLRPLEQ